MELSLLEFFKTAKLGSVAVGTSREKVLQALGTPDYYLVPQPDLSHYQRNESPLWYYGGIELHFDGRVDADHSNDLVVSINVKPFRLFGNRRREVTHVNSWIFRSTVSPKISRLNRQLELEGIEFEDKGLDMIVMTNLCKKSEFVRFSYVPGTKHITELIGTVYVKSGLLISYDGNGKIELITTDLEFYQFFRRERRELTHST